LDAFERGMHDLQDSFVHYDNGYRFPLGHAIDSILAKVGIGTDPDSNMSAVGHAESITEFYTNVWNSNGGNGGVKWNYNPFKQK